jgi:hypothetical protein
MDAISAFAGVLGRPLSHRERGDHWIDRLRDAGHRRPAANQADFRIPQRTRSRSLQFGGMNPRRPRFLAGCGVVATPIAASQYAGIGPDFADLS